MSALAGNQSHSPQLYGVRFSGVSTRGEGTVLLTSARVFAVAAIFVIMVGAGLRFYHLGQRSLWFDEAVTANVSRGTFAEAVEETRARGSAPIIHPTILYLAEKIGKSADVVRAPSLAASLFAVVMMLMMVRAGIGPWSALFAAAILAVSGSQVRYAQEVREYSLAVLYGAVLIYCLLRWEVSGSRDRHPVWLYATMFFAPLTQYGLVFLAGAILGTMLLRCVSAEDTNCSVRQVILGSFFLVCGAVLSYAVTLRFQFRPGKGQWYLAENYFDRDGMGPLRFLATNSKQILSFFIPGQIVAVCFVLALVVFCWKQGRARHFETITFVVFLSFGLTICASLLKMYPYGGIRQCLFLAPGLILLAGVAFGDIVQSLQEQRQLAAVLAILVLILVSGYRGLVKQWPYKEYEDTVSILKELSRSSAPTDEVWVNHDAVEAIDFYLQGRDRRFVYGKYQTDPREYIPELSSAINPHTKRLWLVFSHLEQPSDLSEEHFIVQSLSPEWTVRSVVTPTNAALYVAQRPKAQ
jgi:uncharacterized membrane protein